MVRSGGAQSDAHAYAKASHGSLDGRAAGWRTPGASRGATTTPAVLGGECRRALSASWRTRWRARHVWGLHSCCPGFWVAWYGWLRRVSSKQRQRGVRFVLSSSVEIDDCYCLSSEDRDWTLLVHSNGWRKACVQPPGPSGQYETAGKAVTTDHGWSSRFVAILLTRTRGV